MGNATALPLTAPQMGVWLDHQAAADAAFYNVAENLRIRGPLDTTGFARALQQVVDRTEALRIRIFCQDALPQQAVVSHVPCDLKIIDLRRRDDAEAAAREWMDTDLRRPFALDEGPLFRFVLFHVSAQCHLWYYKYHHVVADGAGMAILAGRVADTYTALQHETEARWTPNLAWADVVREDLAYTTSTQKMTDRDFWLSHCRDLPQPKSLSPRCDSVREPGRSRCTVAALSQSLLSRLHQLAQACPGGGCRLTHVLYALLHAYVARLTGESDIAMGVARAGRAAGPARATPGMFSTVMVPRIAFPQSGTLRELMATVTATLRACARHDRYPLQELVRELGILPTGRSKPFRVLFNFLPFSYDFRFCDAPVERESLPLQCWDLAFVVRENRQSRDGQLELHYAEDLYARSEIELHCERFLHLLQSAPDHLETPLCDLPLLRPSERARLVEWNAPAADYPRDKCVHQLFETQVEETPDGLAVVCEDQQLSYRELNARANQLAHHLRGLGVGPEVMVGLCLERSIELVVGILGIIKAGGAYVPLDPTYPRRRLEFMLRDTQAPVVLTQHHLAERLPPHAGAVIRLDADGPGIARQDASNPESTAGPDSLVYVMYTSGSTGEPKGTCIEHRGVVRLVKNTNYVELTPREVLLQLASISFDASTFEIWGALLNGARLVVFPPDTPSLRELGTFIRARGITTLLLTTPLFHQMVDSELASLAGVRQLLTGGDVLSVRHAQQVLDTLGDRRLINGYGPTENTTFTCCHVMTCNSTIENTVPIGRPISNTRVYVLDEQRRPVPIGVWGELYIGGDGLARGYLNQPRLTEEKFVPDPFSEEVSSRLYRSGDIVRWQGDGALEFRGREDHQVKIHGYRVELAEIESALSAERQVREAVVVARDDGSGGKRLVAYIVPSVGEDGQAVSLSVSQLRAYLGERLPEYMIPAAFVYLHSLPLTANGKVDRRNLPAPEGRRQLEGEYVPPRTPVEEQLCAIWQQQLGLDRVGVHDNFFKLGGHSLMVMQLVFRIAKELQTELAMRDVFAHPTIAQLALLISRDADEAELPSRQRIKPVAGHRGLPLSYSQERLWFLHSFAPDQANNISAAYRLCGPLQVAALEQSLDEIIRRQESLRTTISASEGIPVQSIAPHEPFRLTVSDVSHLSEAERKATLEQLLTAEAEHIFDLDRGPLFRARLVCLGPSEHMFQLTVHHIVFDGWSLGLFRRELATLYRAFRTGRPSPLADLSIRYADFAVWQRARLQGERRATQLDYWKRQLGGAPPALELPSDRPRPSIQTHRGAHQHVFLSRDLSDLLQTLSKQEGVTLFMTLLTAFQLLLHRLAGQDDIVVGTPIAGRAAIETEKLIGLFLNNLVLRTDFSGNPPFRDALARVRRVALDAYAHQDIPFETLVEELRVERDPSRTPLFQVFFNMLTLEEQPFDLPGLSIEPLSFGRPRANFDLTLYVRESPHGISLDLVYNSDLFDRERMVELLAQFRHLLTQIAEHPEREISAFSLVTDDSRTILPDPRVLLDEPKYELVPTRFCNQANARPAQVAVLQDERIWTYGELADRARRLAQVLLTEEDERGEVVAVTGPSSFGLIASMLGVMLSGRVLLTLDQNLPERRQQLMLREARARRMIAVGRPHDEQGCEIWAPLTIIDVDPDTGDAVRRDQDVPRQSLPLPALAPDDAAYVFFTSGTAGVPKGVVGSHKGLAHFLHWQQQTFEIGPRDRIAQMTGLSFDVVLREIFLPLTSGATLCLPPRDAPWEPARMFEWMDGQQISILHAVPALAESWLINVPTGFSLRTLRWFFLAGEPLTDALVRRWRDAFPEAGQIVNLYGPTETTLAKCFYRVPDQIPAGIQPVGLPQPATQALLLRENGHLCGIGEPGEIVIRTPFRSLGYLNAPAENRRAFVQNPFRDDPHDLVYRTGDRGRYRPDGLLEILGRLDDQLKIRGVRIEPGEIAAVLGQHPGIKQVFVMAYEEVAAEKREESPLLRESEPIFQGADKRLVAYVVAVDDPMPTTSELRNFLELRLPIYMVPSQFVMLKRLPLTPNGKVDRRALPAPGSTGPQLANAHLAPRTTVERELARIWCEVLQVDRVGVHDNFFELGGHSLMAVRVVSRVRDALSTEVSLVDFFAQPTVGGLALTIIARAGAAHADSEIPRRDDQGPCRLSFAQERLWILDQLEPDSCWYNIPYALRLSGSLDLEALRQALDNIVTRHESLRTTITLKDDMPCQFVNEPRSVDVRQMDLQNVPADRRELEAQRLLVQAAQGPFHLSRDPMLRGLLLKMAAEEHILLLVMHHIASDGWSLDVLSREFYELYLAFATGRPPRLPELPIQYADFALWQRRWLQGEVLEKQLRYWRQQLEGAPAVLELPTDRPRPHTQTARGARHPFTLPRELSQALTALSRQENATLFMTLLAAYATLLQRYSGQSDIVVGTPIANRNRTQIEGLIGFFVNTLAFRINLADNPTFRQLLSRVRETALHAYEHQDLPFEKLVEQLQPERHLDRSPLFQVMFALQNVPSSSRQLMGLDVRRLVVDAGTAKFDQTLFLGETDEGLWGIVEYSTDLFEESTIERMVGHYQTILAGIVADPQQRVTELPLLTEAERQQLLRQWNTTASDYPRDKCVHRLLEAQVERTPDAVAVVCEDQQLTYRELNARANQLAHYLRDLDVGPASPVGLFLDRSPEIAVGILGILKAGGAYVPLDSADPPQRWANILEDAGVQVMITQDCHVSRIPPHLGATVRVDADGPAIAKCSRMDPAGEVAAADLAYVLFTSGSTGHPKGVAMPHRPLVNLIQWHQRHPRLGRAARTLQFAPVTFDVSFQELLTTWCTGGSVVLVSDDIRRDPVALLTTIEATGIERLFLPFVALQQLAQVFEHQPQGLGQLRDIISAGESLLLTRPIRALLRKLKHCRLHNHYGPTECHVVTSETLADDDETWGSEASIGRPLPNVHVYLLDGHSQLVPIGVPGELFVGGMALARGYLNRPELTAERFVHDPFAGDPVARMYRTGDLARWRPDGRLEFLGRRDQQVKLRGFRIELGEIESALSAHEEVREAVVVARKDEPDGQRLVAYFVPVVGEDGQAVSILVSRLRSYLGERLPEYMVPATFECLPSLPRTPHGKVDRRNLPAPEGRRQLDSQFVAPRTPVEQELARIWCEVLRLERVGVHDNFFELGGHSLTAVRVVSRLRDAFATEVPLADFFAQPTVAGLTLTITQCLAAQQGENTIGDLLSEIESAQRPSANR